MYGALTIRPPTKPPRDTSTQVQFTHGPPLGSAISSPWSPGAARAVDGASLLHGPLRVDRNAETEKKVNGVDGTCVDAMSRNPKKLRLPPPLPPQLDFLALSAAVAHMTIHLLFFYLPPSFFMG